MVELLPGTNNRKMKNIGRHLFKNGIIILLFALMACDQKVNSQTQEQIYLNVEAEEFKSNMQAEKGDFLLVDVRTKGEFDGGAIANAQNYDIMNGDFQKMIDQWNPSTPIYVYCAKGGRSSQAAKLLEQKGFERIIELKGGYSAWK